MATSRASLTYATALNRNELFESPGLRRDIPALLHPDEDVLLVLPGVAGDVPDVVIATEHRFLHATVAGPLKRSSIKHEVPAAGVAGVQYRPGLLSRMRVGTASGREIRMVPSRRRDAERFAREFEHLLRTGSPPS